MKALNKPVLVTPGSPQTRASDIIKIGHPSPFHNPYYKEAHLSLKDRRESLVKFIDYLDSYYDLITKVRTELVDKPLLCHCNPTQLLCHGHILICIANGWLPIRNESGYLNTPEAFMEEYLKRIAG